MSGALQDAFNQFVHLGHLAWNEGGFSFHKFAIQPLIGGLIIFASGLGMILVGVFELLLAKIMTSVLLTTAPLFIGFTLFTPTQGFFDRWLGALVGYALIPLFVSAILALTLAVSDWALSDAFSHPVFSSDGLNVYVITAVVGILGIFMVLRVAHLAQSIGGTVCTSGASGFVGGFVMGSLSRGSGVLSKGKGPLKKIGNLVSRLSKRPSKADEKFKALQQQCQQGKSP